MNRSEIMKVQKRRRELKIIAALALLIVSVILAFSSVSHVIPIQVNATAATILQNPGTSSQFRRKDDQDDVIRVDTNLVTIPATVMDRNGRYVTDLQKENFQIVEDGIEQEVAFVAPVEQPFTILFLLDVSSSMGFSMEDLAEAANAFVSQLRPDDKLIAASFDDWVKVMCEDTKVSDLRKPIKLQRGNSTWLYHAVDYALKRMKKTQGRGRKAIVLFSDGMDSRNFVSGKGNLRDAEEQDAVIYTVQFNSALFWSPFVKQNRKEFDKSIEVANNYMKNLAVKTGGRAYEVESLTDLRKTFGRVADELRRQYSLGYYPKKRLEQGERRQIKVKVTMPNLVVRFRESYTVDKDRAKGK